MDVRFRLIVVLLLFFLKAGNITAQTKAEKLDEFMSICHQYRIFNGTVLVAEKGKVIYQKAFGPANREWNVPNALETKYVIGSISKQFTATLILQLAEEGKLRLEAKIGEYLPDFPQDKAEKVSIHHLLCHSSGIPNNLYFDNWYSELWYQDYTTDELVRLFYDLDLEFEPGSRFNYCNTGYYICAAIIEKITGKKYEEVLQEGILDPLGMKNSGFQDAYTIVPKMASTYEYWNFRFSRSVYSNPSSSRGAGSIYSTVGDLFKWDQAFYSEQILSQKYMDLMFQPHMPLRLGANYAYGWVVGEISLPGRETPIKYAEHTGAQPGHNCLLIRLVEDKHCVVLCNNSGQTDLRLLRDGIIRILYDQSVHVKEPISLVLYRAKDLEEVNAGIRRFQDQRDNYAIRRDAVNGLGFQFMLQGKHSMGLALLEFNAKEFPNSPWVYESLGEAYLMVGKEDLAIKNLEKAFELDPKNSNVRKILDDIRKNANM